jgi:hypothetical protein
MSNFLKIKPVYSGSTEVYPYANAIMWCCNYLYRNSSTAKLSCDLVNLTTITETDNDGIIHTYDSISPSLLNFEMELPYEILNAWGPDNVIDDFVLTYSSDFERE